MLLQYNIAVAMHHNKFFLISNYHEVTFQPNIALLYVYRLSIGCIAIVCPSKGECPCSDYLHVRWKIRAYLNASNSKILFIRACTSLLVNATSSNLYKPKLWCSTVKLLFGSKRTFCSFCCS